ncbi:hypothetical protein AVEN_267807-1 [Araneus ventricosus]|uniref:Tc1-like transposase DDE domain-containing protein n=1 Tax=Araneus ventricosus TaxID=182803 RepID=A0A4Y2D6N2_ARAVE|nr:hypothetical protein AVEN_267807-1 [Araneus ventricosus]
MVHKYAIESRTSTAGVVWKFREGSASLERHVVYARWSPSTVRHFLNATYPSRWIGCGVPVAWPPRSPDLNPLDFFFWGHMKSLVYEMPVDSDEDAVVAADKINTTPGIFERVHQSFLRRCELCNDTRTYIHNPRRLTHPKGLESARIDGEEPNQS